ncbi:MAG: thioredoxin family protein [Epsilonproteobacteria bacterium]|nr:thioredoxin family protein [Campylobacterota bacterium]
MAKAVNDQNFDQEVMQSSTPVVVKFFATECGACKTMAPVFEELAEEMSSCKFAEYNIDNSRESAVQMNVASVPTFVIIKDGHEVGRANGSMSKDNLKKKIEASLG